ncbi:hypothetical protein CANCADRAFT_16356, partial [Tortispora caseinolytica NRRL Y-17796]
MGAVSSSLNDPAAVYMANEPRLRLDLINVISGTDTILSIETNDSSPATMVTAKREAKYGLVEFVQDVDAHGVAPLLLKVYKGGPLKMQFHFTISQIDGADTSLSGLTFIHASSVKDIDNIVNRDFRQNPNMHTYPNARLLGDYSTNGQPSFKFIWEWTWTPYTTINTRYHGWRNSICFADYNKETHSLCPLVQFSFWIQDLPKTLASPLLDQTASMSAVSPSPIPSNSTHTEDPFSPSSLSSMNGLRICPSESSHSDSTEILVTPSSINIPVLEAGASPQASPSIGLVMPPRPEDLNHPEDGPVFRATMAELEKRTAAQRAKIKRLLKSAQSAYESQIASNEQYEQFLNCLKSLSEAENSPFRNTYEFYFERVGRIILNFQSTSCKDLLTFVIEPVKHLYDVDIKSAEFRKKEFDEESREYYNWTSRYLSKQELAGKKKHDIDTKYQDKKKTFELHRFDYYSFMQDLHGGRKENEIVYQLCQYGEAQARSYLDAANNIQILKPELDTLLQSAGETNKEWIKQRSGREEQRRALQKQSSVREKKSITGSAGPKSPAPREVTNISSPGSPFSSKPDPDLDIESRNARKEGLLWALNRPVTIGEGINLNISGWHKYWVTVSGGRLSEYTNWKQNPEMHNEPINLQVAQVREARSKERRFCFEVVTPSYKRIYQATSEDDMASWISAISNAILSSLDGTGSTVGQEGSSTPTHTKHVSNNIQNVLSRGLSSVNRRNTVSENIRNLAKPIVPGKRSNLPSLKVETDQLNILSIIKGISESNCKCADCDSPDPSWISINLMITLCIDCGGVHRSLGTHISKVRSLTLDTVSFTPDFIEAMKMYNNKLSNNIWEALLPPGLKPQPNADKSEKSAFIMAKYNERKFLE